jgi:hypothetical protein
VSTITFHGGDNSITYPWGNYPHIHTRAPDEYAFESVAKRLQTVTGKHYGTLSRGIHQYDIGTMSNMVYPCKGPYEDFVYAGSFDPKNMKICTPVYSTNHITEFGKMNGYPASRQRYTD